MTTHAPMWTPGLSQIEASNIRAFTVWLREKKGLQFDDYQMLWQWSVSEIESFWGAIWEYYGLGDGRAPDVVLKSHAMPGADWFPGERLNYAEQVLRRCSSTGPALLHVDEELRLHAVPRDELVEAVLRLADAFRHLGVREGDCIVATLSNRPEAMIAMLATTAIGAVWSVCSPEAGVDAILDRFSQLKPKILIASDSYRFKGRVIDRRREFAAVVEALPSLDHVVRVPDAGGGRGAPPAPGPIAWAELLSGTAALPPLERFEFAQLPFSHPLWVLFSSGTTGLPKAMTHSHGGILIEQLKAMSLHNDLHPGERVFFNTITGWMMWNFLVGTMLVGAVPILFEDHPTQPEIGRLWQVAARAEATVFGASPSYVKMLQDAGYSPKAEADFPKLRAVLLSGSPASAECVQWFLDEVKSDLWVHSGSGGTDVCSGFVCGVPVLPVYPGEIQARALGVAVHAFDEGGRSRINQVGEMVIVEPMPSMPVRFWGDTDGESYRSAYFDTFPGVWRHGDFFMVNERGGCFVLGRSDATLNRHGVRIGTAEIYRALERVPGIADALIVNIELKEGGFWMPLFVKLEDDEELDSAFDIRIRSHLRGTLSPRHVPDEIIAVPDIPYTLTGKRLEVPVRRILAGEAIEVAVGRGTTNNPSALDFFVQLADQRQLKAAS